MLTYVTLKKNPRRFLSLTSLTVAEFEALHLIFAAEYQATVSRTHTAAGKLRQRQVGGGNQARLATSQDKLLFILVYYKTYPLQTAHGAHFGLGQSQTNEWIHRLLAVLARSLTRLGQMPLRGGNAVATQLPDAPPDFLLDGTERRRQRPQDSQKQRDAYSGKKKRIPTRT